MKLCRYIILFCFFLNNASAQFTDRYWCFGDSAAIDFRNLNNPVPATSILRSRGTCASICDSSGNLLFYASDPHVDLWENGGVLKVGYIVNKNDQIMEGGDTLVGSSWYQEMIIVPDPGNINRFYLFHIGVTSSLTPGFYYSVIDLNYNGGLGKVIQKNIQLQTFPVCDGLAAVKHGNGRDWWVVLKHWYYSSPNNDFYSYLITPTGISGPFIQQIGTAQWTNILRLKFTQDGSKLFQTSAWNLIEEFNFDRCTGQLSNPITIEQQDTTFSQMDYYWSCATSPDNSKLYISSISNGQNQDTSYLFQFDLNATNILASKDTLYTIVKPPIAGLLQMGPDRKIYFSCAYDTLDCDFFYLYCDTTYYSENMNLCVINQPDSLGAACDFQPFSYYLGGHRSYMGLPNNPNY